MVGLEARQFAAGGPPLFVAYSSGTSNPKAMKTI